MKKIISVLCLCVAVTLMSSAQNPVWITADDPSGDETNTWIEFRKEFNLKKIPKKAEAHIAADTKFWLWVNDSLAVFEGGLKRGPNRRDTYYDVIDIAPYLRTGENDVRILLWHFGRQGFSHSDSGQSGIIVNVPSVGLVSDASWKSRRLNTYQSCGEPSTNFRLAESSIRYDARQEGMDDFRPSLEICGWNEGVWGKLVERPIPQWCDSGIITTAYDRYDDGQGNTILSVRLPYNMQITPYIDVSDDSEGTTIRLETDHAFGGSDNCVRAEYITRQGRQQYESFGWMNGDVLRIIYPTSSGLTVHSVGYRETGYGCTFEGSFCCSDSTINRFWQKAMRTLYVNMRDNYFDCPDRERAQWWGDVTILMGQSFYQLSPKANALMRKAIRELVDWQKDDGVIYSPIPAGNWDSELPAQSLAAVSTYGFWYYYMNTGDKETMAYAYPAMRRYLSLWALDDDGLTVERQGGWPWGDWGTDVDMRLMLAAWHYLALQSAINIAELTGNEADIPEYRRQMRSVYSAFNRCWNGDAYRHPSYGGATDDRVQAMAVVSGLADRTKYEQIYDVIRSQEYASPYMEKYVYEALMKMGYADYAFERFKRRFGPMIDDPDHTTLYEGWQEGGYGGGSVNHAWSGGMLTDICELILGIRPAVPGWKEVMIHPSVSPLREARITIPTVSGLLSYSFNDCDDVYEAVLIVPDGMKIHFTAPDGYTSSQGRTLTLKAGTHHLEFIDTNE